MTKPKPPDGGEEDRRSKALAALRQKASERFFPASSSPVKDASVELLPRLVGADIAFRSRILEELSVMQTLLMHEMLRPLKDRRPDSLSSLIREQRGLIRDQLALLDRAPISLTADGAKRQVRDILERHALVAAELRRKGLGKLLDAITRSPGVDGVAVLPEGVRALLGGDAAAVEASTGEQEQGEPPAGVS